MLTLRTSHRHLDCQGTSRRDFLRAGVLGLGGLTLPWLLEQKARAAAVGTPHIKNKSVILIFLAGGASHIETFNPNMDAPEPFCSVTGAVRTSVPGMMLGGTFPMLAQYARHMAVVRSFRHPIGDHVQAINHVLTGGTDVQGRAQDGFAIGAMVSKLRGSNHPRTGMPTYALLSDPHSDPQYRNEMGRVATGSRGGTLGPAAGPFTPNSGGGALDNMTLHMSPERLAERRGLLHGLDQVRRGVDAGGARLDHFERQAADLLLGGASRALDLEREDRRIYERYDTSRFLTGKKEFNPSIIGQQLLLARRLIEAGAGFVTVQSAGWDMHADGNNPGIESGMEMLGRPLDKALSALVGDLEQRGMLDDVLIVITGDFGRTPTINRNGGRDHWTNLCTLAFIGGGLKLGQVIGQCDRQNRQPTTTPIGPGDLLSTLMYTLFDVGGLRVTGGAATSLVRVIDEHRPIAELF